jgi:hypothetical protein
LSGSAGLACGDTTYGATLPALAAFSSGATALVAFYDARYIDREDPVAGCSSAATAVLDLVPINAPATATPDLQASTIKQLSADSTSVRPAALVTTPNAILAAAPNVADVGIWAIGSSLTVSAPTTMADMANARAVALAVNPMGKLALAAEIGCTPTGALKVAFGSFAGAAPANDGDPSGVTMGAAVDLVPAGSTLAVQPSVAWVTSRNEWLVTWITEGPTVRAQRYQPDGTPIGGPFDVSYGSTVGAAGANGDGFVFDPIQTGNEWDEITLGCP